MAERPPPQEPPRGVPTSFSGANVSTPLGGTSNNSFSDTGPVGKLLLAFLCRSVSVSCFVGRGEAGKAPLAPSRPTSSKYPEKASSRSTGVSSSEVSSSLISTSVSMTLCLGRLSRGSLPRGNKPPGSSSSGGGCLKASPGPGPEMLGPRRVTSETRTTRGRDSTLSPTVILSVPGSPP